MSNRAVRLGRVGEYFHQSGIPFYPNAILTASMLREHASGFLSDNIKPAWLLKQMDYAAVTVCRIYLRPFGEKLRVLTVGVPEVRVFQPVTVLDDLETLAWPVRIGNKSMVVRVEGYAARREKRERRLCFEALFAFVAYDPAIRQSVAFPQDPEKMPLVADDRFQSYVDQVMGIDRMLDLDAARYADADRSRQVLLQQVTSSRYGVTRSIRPRCKPLDFASSHRTVIAPKDTNLLGNLHGGDMLRAMAEISFGVAAKYYGTQDVHTVGMSQINIKKSAKEGWYLIAKGRIVALTPDHMVVQALLLASDLGDIRHQTEIASGYFYLQPELPIGQVLLPELDLCGEDDQNDFLRGMLRSRAMMALWSKR